MHSSQAVSIITLGLVDMTRDKLTRALILKVIIKNNSKSICPRDLKFFWELHTNDPQMPLKFCYPEVG